MSFASSSSPPVCRTNRSVALFTPHRQAECNAADCQASLLTGAGAERRGTHGREHIGLWQTPSTIWAISRPRDNTRYEALRSGALGGVQSPPEEVHAPVVTCLCYEAASEWHLGEFSSCHAAIAEAISLAKELNDMPALANALNWAVILGYYERNPVEVERLASDLIELSTRHHFAYWLAIGIIFRGWARSTSGDVAAGIASIEDGIEHCRATGSRAGGMPALQAEALHLADRTSEALKAIREAEALVERREERGGLPNCTGSTVCFSRLWVPTRPKLKPHSAKPSESQRSRSRFRWRNAPKQPTRNTAAEERQESTGSDYLFVRWYVRRKHGPNKLKTAAGVPNCTGSKVSFSRLWVPTTPKLKPHSGKPSELQRNRSRFRWRSARKQPTQNTAKIT